MSKKLKMLALVVLCVSCAAQAKEETTNNKTNGVVMAQFSTCHAPDFFKAIGQNAKMFSGVPLEKVGVGQYIKVKNREATTDSSDTRVIFSVPKMIEGIKVLGFYDSYDPSFAKISADLGSFLFWGFYVSGTPETVSAQINQSMAGANKLQKSADGTFGNGEIRYITSPIGFWEKAGDNSGKLAKAGTTERALIIEALGDKEAQEMGLQSPVVSVFCTIQGSVNNELLQFERPDIKGTK